MLKKRIIALVLVALMAATFVPTALAAPRGLTAQAAVVIDFDTGEVLFERDAHTRRAPASMTKSMTAFITYEEIAAGNLTMDTRIRVSANAARKAENNPGSRRIAAGSYYTVNDLLHMAMLPSSNRACIVLAEHISGSEAAFVVRMNETAAELGLSASFTNVYGAHNAGHNSTAHSMGMLVYEFINRHPDILRITNTGSRVVGGQNQTNTNRFVHNRQVAGLDGFKTGTHAHAGFCIQATAVRNGRRIITVVMNSPNNDRRYSDTRLLMDFGFAELARRDAARAYEDARRVFVQLNGELMNFDVPPRLYERRTLVPMRAIFEALDATVIWDDDTQTITATKGENAVSMRIGSTVATINGQNVTLDVPPAIVDGRTLVPLRFVVQALEIPMEWEAENRTVVIRTEEEEEENDSPLGEMSEAQAIGTMLYFARQEFVDDSFMLMLVPLVELVNFYMDVEEPVAIAENAQRYAQELKAASEKSGSGLYIFWNLMGPEGAIMGPDGVIPSYGDWPEWDYVVPAAIELREIVEQVNN